MRMGTTCWGAAAGAALMLWAAHAHASPQDIFGYGTRAPALGGTGAAWAEGVDATYANPALLSAVRARELTLGYVAAGLSLRATGSGMPGKLPADALTGTLIGVVLPLPLGGVMRDRLALGLGFFTPTDVVVRGRVLYPDTPQFGLLADRMQTVAILAGAGLDIGYGIRIGAGVSALAAISGTVVVATDTSGSVGTKVDDQLIASYAKTLSASLDLLGDYRIGVTYRGSLEARFAVSIEVHDLGSLTVPTLNIAGLAQYDPAQVQAEFARIHGPIRASVGATWKRWSAYPGAPEPTVICPPERPDCLALVPSKPGFKNTLVPRIGVEADVAQGQGWKTVARAGYFFEQTPVPEQTGRENFFDSSRHAVTLGAGLDLADPLPPLRVEVFGQWHALQSRTHHKTRDLPPETTDTLQVKTSGRVLMGGVAATVRF